MKYFPEKDTDKLLMANLLRVDPEARGAFVEVGCGGFGFSFIVGRMLGFTTYAIEPEWNEKFREAVEVCGTQAFQGVISDVDGQVTLYHHPSDLNFFSLNKEWNGAEECSVVQSLTWGTFLSLRGITQVTCLKLDVEGSEWKIIQQIKPSLLPKIIVFEYGGQGTSGDGKGGWAEPFRSWTHLSLNRLSMIGYKKFYRLDGEAEPYAGDLAGLTFPPECHYGNIVAMME